MGAAAARTLPLPQEDRDKEVTFTGPTLSCADLQDQLQGDFPGLGAVQTWEKGLASGLQVQSERYGRSCWCWWTSLNLSGCFPAEARAQLQPRGMLRCGHSSFALHILTVCGLPPVSEKLLQARCLISMHASVTGELCVTPDQLLRALHSP